MEEKAEELSTRQQQRILFFRNNYGELQRFIKDFSLTKSNVSFLKEAYDVAETQKRNELRPEYEKILQKESSGSRLDEAEKKTKNDFERLHEKYNGYKEKCFWLLKMVSDKDIFLGIDSFLAITDEKNLTDRTDKLWDTYFQLMNEDEQQTGEDGMAMTIGKLTYFDTIKAICTDERPLGSILSYYGIEIGSGTLGTMGNAYREFASKPPAGFYHQAIALYTTVRNSYAHNYINDEALADRTRRTDLESFTILNARELLKFYIFFYIGLCCLLNMAWRDDDTKREIEGEDIYTLKRKVKEDIKEYHIPAEHIRRDSKLRCTIEVRPERGDKVEEIRISSLHLTEKSARFSATLSRGVPYTVTIKYKNEREETDVRVTLDASCWEDTTVVLAQSQPVRFEHKLNGALPTTAGDESAADQKEVADETPQGEDAASSPAESLSNYELVALYESLRAPAEPKVVPDMQFEALIDGRTALFTRNIPDESGRRMSYFYRRALESCEESGIWPYKLSSFTEKACLDETIHIPEYVTSPNGAVCRITEIGKSAFEGREVTHLVLPDSITAIGDRAFAMCERLETIVLPAGLEQIGEAAFKECRSLKELSLTVTLKSIGKQAFMGCAALKEVSVPDVEEIQDETFRNCANLQELTLPSRLKKIGNGAFMGCAALKEVSVPGLINVVPERCFKDCAALEKVYFGADGWSRKTIRREAFAGCGSLREVLFEEKGRIGKIESAAFAGCLMLKQIDGESPFWLMRYCRRDGFVSYDNMHYRNTEIEEGAFEKKLTKLF